MTGPKSSARFGRGWKGAAIVALAGGVGGSRFIRGLRNAAPRAQLTAVVNTADDLTVHGLRISPDVDTVLYALGNRVDDQRGWGPRGDTFRAMEMLETLGGETWFRLGDLDIGLHLRRTELLAAGRTPTEVTQALGAALGIHSVRILPMSNDPVETWICLAEEKEWVPFQEYFVHRRADVAIQGTRFAGVESARPAPGVLEAIQSADLVAICPSNPFVSIQPILAVPKVREAVLGVRARGSVVAGVSPIIGGSTVKGPAARMLAELGFEPSSTGVAVFYTGILDALLIDTQDEQLNEAVAATGARPIVADSLMKGRRGEARLAGTFLQQVIGPEGK